MHTRDRITAGIGLFALLAAELGLGGAPRHVVVVIVLVAAVAAAAQLTSRRKLEGISPLLLFIGIAWGLTALQLIPLPPAVLDALSSEGHGLVVDSDVLLGADPDAANSAWRPLTLDPPATLVELAKFTAYFLIAWMALRAATAERGRYRLLATVAILGGLVAVIGIGHEVLDADALYGFYTPVHAHPIVMAPLLNANHLACLMALTAIVSAGLAVHERKVPAIRVLWIVISVCCVGVALASRSRGGVVGLGAGATITAVLVVLQRLRESRQSSRRDVLRIAIPAALTVLCTLVLVVSLGGDKVRHDLEATSISELDDPRSKFMAWSAATDLFAEAPVLGVGRGGFETSFTRVYPASNRLTFSHVENEYLQTLLDWGVVGAVMFAIAIGYAGLFLLRRWHRGSLTASGIGALAAVSVQSLVDFGTELPGVAVPVVLVASTLLYVPVHEASGSSKRLLVRGLTLAGAVIVALLAGSPMGTTIDEDHRALQDAPTVADAKSALARHPLDYLSAAFVASSSTQPREQISFTNHALRLHPTHADLHHAVARWLVATKRFTQAALEYRFALLRDDKLDMLVAEIVNTLPPADATLAFPTAQRLWSRIVTMLTRQNRIDLAIAYLEVAASDDPKRGRDFWLRLYTLASQGDKHASALRAARQLESIDGTPAATVRVAKSQLKLGEELAATQTLKPLTSVPPTTPDHIEAHLLVCSALVTRKDWEPAKTCLRKTLQLPGVGLSDRRLLHHHLATVETALGNERGAVLERELAGENTP